MKGERIEFLAFCLLAGNLISLIIDGAWFQPDDHDLMKYLTGISIEQTASWTAIFTLPIGFFTHAIPKLLLWDFVFFTGTLELVRWFCLVVSIGTIYVVASQYSGTIQNIFGRR